MKKFVVFAIVMIMILSFATTSFALTYEKDSYGMKVVEKQQKFKDGISLDKVITDLDSEKGEFTVELDAEYKVEDEKDTEIFLLVSEDLFIEDDIRELMAETIEYEKSSSHVVREQAVERSLFASFGGSLSERMVNIAKKVAYIKTLASKLIESNEHVKVGIIGIRGEIFPKNIIDDMVNWNIERSQGYTGKAKLSSSVSGSSDYYRDEFVYSSY